MNPPQSVNPDYDRGYSDGYRDRGVMQIWFNLQSLSRQELTQVRELQEKHDLAKVSDRI